MRCTWRSSVTTSSQGGYQARLAREDLSPIHPSEADQRLLGDAGIEWSGAITGQRRKSYLTWDDEGPSVRLQFDPAHSGRPRMIAVGDVRRTVLSASASAEYQTLLTAREEMRSWRFVALEPSAMRAPDDVMERRPGSAAGAHLPASLFRRSQKDDDPELVYREVRDVVGALVNIRHLEVREDTSNQVLELRAQVSDAPVLPARSLSDGTLRFLALATMGAAAEYVGLICMEEPENGIHPGKMTHMAELLAQLARP